MKAMRLFLFFLLAVLVVVAVMAFLLPTYQRITKTITINAPAASVYDQLKTIRQFNQVTAWNSQDSNLQYTYTGTDGSIGAAASWKGSPEISGEGRIEITNLQPGQKIGHKIQFIAPRKGSALSSFTLNALEKTSTEVKWVFEMATPRPWNIFNLFYSLDEKMGKEFETGLVLLKKLMESQNTAPQNP
jgi:hypothetical protein